MRSDSCATRSRRTSEKPFFTLRRVRRGALSRIRHRRPSWRSTGAGSTRAGTQSASSATQRQLELGIIPPGTELAPRNPGVPAWDSLSDEEKLVSSPPAGGVCRDGRPRRPRARPLRRRSSTPSASSTTPSSSLMADNGASQEGGPGGTTNIVAYENGHQPDLAFNLARLDEIGGPRSQTNYPQGWAQVGNTPLRRYKQNTHAGGVRAPMIVSWPAGMPPRSEVRQPVPSCDRHRADHPRPGRRDGAAAAHHGVPQMPLHGVSLRYSFDDAAAPTAPANAVLRDVLAPRDLARGLEGGVVSSSRPELRQGRVGALPPGRRFLGVPRPGGAASGDARRASSRPGGPRPASIGVLPLDDRGFPERAVRYHSSGSPRRRTRLSLYPGISRIPSGAAPLLVDRSFRIRPTCAATGQPAAAGTHRVASLEA